MWIARDRKNDWLLGYYVVCAKKPTYDAKFDGVGWHPIKYAVKPTAWMGSRLKPGEGPLKIEMTVVP